MLQIIGTMKCRNTQKAIRFCKERRIPYQFVDLRQHALSPREWISILQGKNAEDLVDVESEYYKKNGYAYREYDSETELIEHVELLKTPVLRTGQKAVVGYDEAFMEGAK